MQILEAILTQEEKDGGVCYELILELALLATLFFNEEGIIRSGVISMGGDDVTQEIAFAFDTSFEEAKRLKEHYGNAKSSVTQR